MRWLWAAWLAGTRPVYSCGTAPEWNRTSPTSHRREYESARSIDENSPDVKARAMTFYQRQGFRSVQTVMRTLLPVG